MTTLEILALLVVGHMLAEISGLGVVMRRIAA